MLMQRWQQSAGGTHSPAEKYPAQLILYIKNINQSLAIGKSMFTDRSLPGLTSSLAAHGQNINIYIAKCQGAKGGVWNRPKSEAVLSGK